MLLELQSWKGLKGTQPHICTLIPLIFFLNSYPSTTVVQSYGICEQHYSGHLRKTWWLDSSPVVDYMLCVQKVLVSALGFSSCGWERIPIWNPRDLLSIDVVKRILWEQPASYIAVQFIVLLVSNRHLFSFIAQDLVNIEARRPLPYQNRPVLLSPHPTLLAILYMLPSFTLWADLSHGHKVISCDI